jgi:hypothetical protein
MEGRTKFNYGYNSGLITMKDINYMFNIINSNLSEEEKAIKLYLENLKLKKTIKIIKDYHETINNL